MSWLDLPPDPNEQPISLASAATNPDDGLAPVLLSLVGSGVVGLWTPYGLEVWTIPDAARLASVLGVGIVERTETAQGWAETGYVDPASGVLHVRQRNPHDGAPRRFQLESGMRTNDGLDPWSAWQLERVADSAYRRGERWAIRQGGYQRSDFELGVTSQVTAQGRQVILTATPAHVGRVWRGKAEAAPAFARSSTLGDTFAVTVTATREGVRRASQLLVEVLKREDIRPWEVMACFPSV